MSKQVNINSLAHTTWNCKYHIVFAPKYRRKVFFGQKGDSRIYCESIKRRQRDGANDNI